MGRVPEHSCLSFPGTLSPRASRLRAWQGLTQLCLVKGSSAPCISPGAEAFLALVRPAQPSPQQEGSRMLPASVRTGFSEPKASRRKNRTGRLSQAQRKEGSPGCQRV